MMAPIGKAVLASLVAMGTAHAAEGMWLPDQLPHARLQSSFAFLPDAGWVQASQQASARLSGSCSASFISSTGLLATTRQCASACAAAAPGAGANNYFYADTTAREQRCEGMHADVLVDTRDVTPQIQVALKDSKEFDRQNEHRAKTAVAQACMRSAGPGSFCEVATLHGGGRYVLYTYRRHDDLRLVFASEPVMATLGKTAADLEFPRSHFDLALLRIHQGEQATATPDFYRIRSTPMTDQQLSISIGNPLPGARGKTSAQLRTEMERDVAHALTRFGELRGLLTRYVAESDEHARIAGADLGWVERLFKSQRARFDALQNPALVQAKQSEQASLKQFVDSSDARRSAYGDPWQAIEAAQATYRALELPFQFKEGRGGFFSKYLGFARALVRNAEEQQAHRSGLALPEKLSETQQLFSTAPIHPDYEAMKLAFTLTQVRDGLGPFHPFTQKILQGRQPAEVSRSLVEATQLGDISVRRALQQGGTAALDASNDAFIKIAQRIEPDAREVRSAMDAYERLVEHNSRLIAKARYAQYGKDVYPYPTGTQRLSFGRVEGWQDGERAVPSVSRFDQLLSSMRAGTSDALPPAWVAAGPQLDGTRVLNFITSNDVGSGDPGAAILDSDGRLAGIVIGTNFAGVGGDYWYDGEHNRVVAMSSDGVLHALGKVYDAQRIVDEVRQSTN